MKLQNLQLTPRLQMPRSIEVAGLDPSLRNWGIASGALELGDLSTLKITGLHVLNAPEPQGKQVRQNSKDVAVAKFLAEKTFEHIQSVKVIFAEIPTGSQTARAMASYGICCGVLGSLQAGGISIIEVTPLEVKMATAGKKTASKREIIEWAMGVQSNAPWPYYKEKGQMILSEAKAEHMADAIGSIYAGFKTSQFQQLMQLSQL